MGDLLYWYLSHVEKVIVSHPTGGTIEDVLD